jgi:hypothetical protein
MSCPATEDVSVCLQINPHVPVFIVAAARTSLVEALKFACCRKPALVVQPASCRFLQNPLDLPQHAVANLRKSTVAIGW